MDTYDVFQEEVSPSLDTTLLLHRKGFDCGLEAKNLGFNCTTNQGKLDPKEGKVIFPESNRHVPNEEIVLGQLTYDGRLYE
ncbi:MA2A2 mannosidase, partial [Polypterus senegalus]